MRFIVTGSAGFIGFHVVRRLIALGHDVVGIDGMTSYYDVTLKRSRDALLRSFNRYVSHEIMLEDADALGRIWQESAPDVVIHLAAQAGVRYSLENPHSYVSSNLVGTFNVLELARHHPLRHLMLASTSSAYGLDNKVPFAETDPANHPITLYAATKKSAEMMAHAYSHLFAIPITAFRFFTVYGPWGRPDMAPFKFVARIFDGQPIDIYNHGDMQRDFTYIDDLVEGVVRLADVVPPLPDARGTSVSVLGDSLSAVAAHRIVNIGNAQPVALMDFVAEIERAIGRKAERRYLDMQPGDVMRTFADTRLLEGLTGFRPETPIRVGVQELVTWYRDRYVLSAASGVGPA